MSRRVEIILGPTAVGKSAYAIRRALEVGSPVISCDSRQIYKELSVGTAVPSPEELSAVKHYFIQTVSVKEGYTAGDYEEDALNLVESLFAQGHEHLVMCGGSMMYIDAFCYGLDDFPDVPLQMRRHLMDCLESEGVEVLAQQLKEVDPETWAVTDLSNGHRIVRALEVSLYTGKPYSSFKTHGFKKRDFEIVKTGLEMPREQLYERINARVLKMMDAGLEEEARRMLPYRDLTALQTVGYKELFDYFDGTISLDEAVRRIQTDTRHYAKRQLTWWRRDKSIRWIDANSCTFQGSLLPLQP